MVRVSSSLLSSRKLPATHCLVPPVGQYALSAWPPSEPKNRLLIFPHNGLAAVFFYGPGGMPELPKPQDNSPVPRANPVANTNMPAPTPQNALIAQVFSQMTPEQQAIFRQMPAEKRKMLLTTLLARMNHSREQQQQIQAQMSNANQQQQHQQPHQQQPQQQHVPHQPLLQPQGLNPWASGGPQPNASAILSRFTGAQGANQAGPSNATPQGQGQGQGMAGMTPSPMANFMQGMNVGGMGGMGGGNMGNMSNNMNMNNMTMNFGMGMPGSQQPGMGGPQGMHRRTPSGNVPGGGPGVGGLSYEMLQSFMQRSQDGGGGSNGSLGGMA